MLRRRLPFPSCCCSPSPESGGGLRAAGDRRPRHPADRQLGHARNRRHPRRRRRGRCADGALCRLADRPAAGLPRALGQDAQSRRSTRRRTCPIRRSTRSSARSTSSASRSAPTATSPISACCSIGRARREFLGVEGGQVQRSAPMLLIPDHGHRRHGDQRRARKRGSGRGRSSAPRRARSIMCG